MTHELNDESLLMLYLADELSAGQRAALEQRLTSEPSLRAALDAMRDAHVSASDALAQIDGAKPLGDAFAMSVARRTSRAMNQWRVDQLRDVPIRSGPLRTPLGRRAVTAASVAILLGGLLAWWGYEAFNLPDKGEFQQVHQLADLDAAPEETEALAQRYASALNRTPTESDESTLSSVEQELDELSSARQGHNPLGGMQ